MFLAIRPAPRAPAQMGDNACRHSTLPSSTALAACYTTSQDTTDLPARNFQEADIKAGVRKSEKVLGVFLITREDDKGSLYVTYLRTSWTRGFLPLRTFRDKADRVYRDLDKLLALLRKDFAYQGEVSIFLAGDAALRRFRALLPTDRQALLLDGSLQPDEDTAPADVPSE